MAIEELKMLDYDPIEHLELGANEQPHFLAAHNALGGEFSLIPGVLAIAWEVNPFKLVVEVKVKVFGNVVASGTLGPNKPLNLNFNAGAVKGEIKLYFEGTSLKFEVKACIHVPVLGWKCQELKGTIVTL